jgi:ferredoxin-fold anticodon binding domain-containing protein
LNLSTYIPIIIIFIILFLLLRNRKAVVARKIIKKRKMEDNTEMIELAKRFIGKECLISAFDSNHQFQGTIKEVSDGAILVENGDSIEAINLDFVIRIREFPKNKKGKKKSVVLD